LSTSRGAASATAALNGAGTTVSRSPSTTTTGTSVYRRGSSTGKRPVSSTAPAATVMVGADVREVGERRSGPHQQQRDRRRHERAGHRPVGVLRDARGSAPAERFRLRLLLDSRPGRARRLVRRLQRLHRSVSQPVRAVRRPRRRTSCRRDGPAARRCRECTATAEWGWAPTRCSATSTPVERTDSVRCCSTSRSCAGTRASAARSTARGRGCAARPLVVRRG
jgi:hypothetical protein